MVHGSASSQFMRACTHCPLAHESTVHASVSAQLRAVPRHTPASQVSLFVQALPSLQATPERSACLHDPPLQESSVHGLLSLQSMGGCMQTPPASHISAVHGSPSSQGVQILSSQTLPPGHWLSMTHPTPTQAA
jgi:hypothetical protein